MTNQTEIEYELELISRGRTAAIEEIKKHESRGGYSQSLPGRYAFNAHVLSLVKELEVVTSEAATGKAGRKNIVQCSREMQHYIELLSSAFIATVAIKSILDAVPLQKNFAKVHDIATAVGNRIEAELWFEFYARTTDEETSELARKRASMPGSTPKYRKYSSKRVYKTKIKASGGQLWDQWSHNHRNRIGLYLLEIARSAGIVAWEKIRLGKKL